MSLRQTVEKISIGLIAVVLAVVAGACLFAEVSYQVGEQTCTKVNVTVVDVGGCAGAGNCGAMVSLGDKTWYEQLHVPVRGQQIERCQQHPQTP